MGVVKKQSFYNTITTYLGFGLGAINVLFLFTHFLTDEYHGLVAFVLSTANIMMPLFALGSHNALIKFHSAFKSRNNLNRFMTFMLFFPLLVIIPVGLIGYMSFDTISTLLSAENPIIKDYVWMIFVAAVCLSYFELFYSWAKVQFQSVFGNILKEVFHRLCILILFGLIYLGFIDVDHFLSGVIVIYVIRTLVMMGYAFWLRKPVFRFGRIPDLGDIVQYALLIIIAGSVATIILEIDKFMIGELLIIENVAYYGVAIYIATVIGVPSRSMHQITNPVTAKLLNENDMIGLKDLYHKSSLNLFIISGLIFVLILININQLYAIIPEKFSGALMVVILVSIAKLSDNLLGNNNAILFNSRYYSMVLLFGFIMAMVTVGLNLWMIPEYGINGAALATLITVVGYNFTKIVFVYLKFRMWPFSAGTVKAALLIAITTLVFYFWDFETHPIIGIALKSVIAVFIYVLVTYRLRFSDDINKALKGFRSLL